MIKYLYLNIVISIFSIMAYCSVGIAQSKSNDPYVKAQSKSNDPDLKAQSKSNDPYVKARAGMIAAIQQNWTETNRYGYQLEPLRASVIKALNTVPRQEFVAKSYASKAYANTPIPIEYGQTVSQPFIVAFMSNVLDLKPNDKVLEIGTGSGYQAAILAELVQHVYSIEVIPQLHQSVVKRLKDLGYHNIHLKEGDGYYGWKKYAPFDAIMVTAALDHVPPALIKQLKKGGKMVIPVGDHHTRQHLVILHKQQDGSMTSSISFPVRFVPFIRLQK